VLTNLSLLAPLLQQARIWYFVLREENAAKHRRRFAAWVKRSPDHVAAYLLVSLAFAIENDIERRQTGSHGLGYYSVEQQFLNRSIFARLYERYEPDGLSDAGFATLEQSVLRRLRAN